MSKVTMLYYKVKGDGKGVAFLGAFHTDRLLIDFQKRDVLSLSYLLEFSVTVIAIRP